MSAASNDRLAEILVEAERLLNELRERTAQILLSSPISLSRHLMDSIRHRIEELDALVYDHEAEKQRLQKEARKTAKSSHGSLGKATATAATAAERPE